MPSPALLYAWPAVLFREPAVGRGEVPSASRGLSPKPQGVKTPLTAALVD